MGNEFREFSTDRFILDWPFDRGPLNGGLTVQHQLITSSQQSISKETSAEIKRDETKSRRQERSMKRREFL